MWRRPLALFLLALSGCAGGEPQCRALVAAPPGEWPARWTDVEGFGPRVAPRLIRALRGNPEGPGAQAAIQLLGVLGNDAARPYLTELLEDSTSLATEAALALGRLPGKESIAALEKALRSKDKNITTRVAAAASLVRLGRAREHEDFLVAVFLAASPHATESARTHGLPRDKIRWAHERYMLIEALRARYAGETFGLDEDASWIDLRAGATRLRAFLDAEK